MTNGIVQTLHQLFLAWEMVECIDNGQDFIGYCFHSVAGYSKVGSYTGNGTTQITGFKPAWILIKSTVGNDNWRL